MQEVSIPNLVFIHPFIKYLLSTYNVPAKDAAVMMKDTPESNRGVYGLLIHLPPSRDVTLQYHSAPWVWCFSDLLEPKNHLALLWKKQILRSHLILLNIAGRLWLPSLIGKIRSRHTLPPSHYVFPEKQHMGNVFRNHEVTFQHVVSRFSLEDQRSQPKATQCLQSVLVSSQPTSSFWTLWRHESEATYPRFNIMS